MMLHKFRDRHDVATTAAFSKIILSVLLEGLLVALPLLLLLLRPSKPHDVTAIFINFVLVERFCRVYHVTTKTLLGSSSGTTST
jgi:hypothetical protein